MENISLFFLIEAIGTIAFASSGAMTAIRKRLESSFWGKPQP